MELGVNLATMSHNLSLCPLALRAQYSEYAQRSKKEQKSAEEKNPSIV